jgi:hypothetical protein
LSDFLLSSSSSISSLGGMRYYSSLVVGLGVWLGPGTVSVEGLLKKCPLLSLPGSEIVAIVPGDFLELWPGLLECFCLQRYCVIS